MPNYLESYISVQDGEIYHIKNVSATATSVVFFDETYQGVGKGRTNLEQPFTIPNSERFNVIGLKIKLFNVLNLNITNKLPLFYLKFLVGEAELFNLHLSELYPTCFVYTSQTATEGTLTTNKINLFPLGGSYQIFGFTRGLEVELLKNVSFRVELSEIENIPSGGLWVGIFLVGTFHRLITG